MAAVVVVIALAGIIDADAFGIRAGRPLVISEAPWNVVVLEDGQEACTGVIIDPSHVLTAGHCLFGNRRIPNSSITVEAGVSNLLHPLAMIDARQMRSVSSTRLMPNYINRLTNSNSLKFTAHDLAVLILSHPLNLGGPDARPALLPGPGAREPSSHTTLEGAGYGEETWRSRELTGGLNELVKPRIAYNCSKRVLCIRSPSGTCDGDSGSGIVEPGSHTTVVGILSVSPNCVLPGFSNYIYLGSTSVRNFVAQATS